MRRALSGFARWSSLWVFLITFAVLAIHPIPECVACDYPNPWGRNPGAYSRDSVLIAVWLILVSFGAGIANTRRHWLVPVAVVVADVATQPLGGVPLWSLWSNEAPMMLLLGLLVGGTSLLIGYWVGVGLFQAKRRSQTP